MIQIGIIAYRNKETNEITDIKALKIRQTSELLQNQKNLEKEVQESFVNELLKFVNQQCVKGEQNNGN